MAEQTYTVLVDDNFHFMDASERYTKGTYGTYEAAVAVCKKMVDEDLAANFAPGMTARQLYGAYTMFGDDPFITPDPGDFSAWKYAEQRSREIVKKHKGGIK